MTSRNSISAIAALASALAIGSTAYAADSSDSAVRTFRIHGVVPTICRVEYSGGVAPVYGSTVDLGNVTELCNDYAGYQIKLVTDANLAGTVIVNGVSITLDPSGTTVIADSKIEGYQVQDIQIQLASNTGTPGAVHFVATPKGAVF